MRHGLAGHLASKLAGRMCAHAIGHHQQMSAAMPVDVVAGERHGKRVLIVTASEPNVGERRLLQRREESDPKPILPQWALEQLVLS